MEPITPHYVTLHLLKLPDIVKLNTCLLFCEYLNNDKIPSFSLTSCSEQHTYYTRSALSDQLVIEPFRTNLRRFCPSIVWFQRISIPTPRKVIGNSYGKGGGGLKS